MYLAWSPKYCHPLPVAHRFPMEKYELVPDQLLHEGVIQQQDIHIPEPIDEAITLLTHETEYWEKLKSLKLSRQEERRTGFPLSAQLIERETIISQGTINCVHHALEHGPAFNVAGGTHHAFTNLGEGFCLLNDQAIAANYLLHNRLSNRILIIDLDVHQGNGTAQIFRNEERVFTLSMHGAKNFPHRKERSDLDIALPDGTGDDRYLNILTDTLPKLFKQVKPDFVFYLAGADVLATDKLGRLDLSLEGCKKRDQIVLEAVKQLGLPLQISMGGGYSPQIKHIVEAHCNTYRLVRNMYY